MRWTKTYIPTLREDPAEAELVSHKLLVRAGYIRKLSAGVYSYLPLMQNVLTKVSQICREEMNRYGGIEILMPVLHPAEIWQESGRWETMGAEKIQLRLKDRNNHDFCLGGTHEEVVTDIVRGEVRSYKQLPLLLYQIQTKFRDEIRPRFGLLRGKEFIMKDAYSFDRDEAGRKISYKKMADAYTAFFNRCGLETVMVESDTGAMGGSGAHEFMVVVETDSGENVLALCDNCNYAANIEKAPVTDNSQPSNEEERELQLVDTPNAGTVEEVTAFLNVPPERLVKTILYKGNNGQVIAALIRGDRAVNEVKLRNVLKGEYLEIADAETVMAATNAPVGYAGPVGLKGVQIIADHEVRKLRNVVTGANQSEKHYLNTNAGRDFHIDIVADIRNAEEGEPCQACGKGKLYTRKGIEVGNIFNLGTKYSSSMNATYMDEKGNELPMIMGSYGIGITRTAQSAIEKFSDDKGMIWPRAIAPYEMIITPLNYDDREQKSAADEIYEKCLKARLNVILDDRLERPGIKLNDADLIGIPLRMTIGKKSLKAGKVELKPRKQKDHEEVDLSAAIWRAEEILSEL
ncbi:MAG: proline--tRNA ligase [candidate division Zixibacteria bacterium]|nr:proline--tRNA ligase [candidate division Zixibacteria bacterium]MBU1469955.1 proline--tRNA ligase [candidate division Zixibacteria bacterium]MBU2626068.1 proline--tRNA ligase [candidate division Zixibacteria bacterium]